MAGEMYDGGEIEREQSSDARTWGMLCHVAAFAGYVVPFLGSIVGPLIVWQIKKDESEFVDYHGKESLNFQITVWIAMFVSVLLCLVLIGIVFVILIPIVSTVFVIIAAVKASNGEYYRYPLTLRLVK
ncbi:MAG: DUF4870 domain-containing protein [Pirellulales bacterium]